MNEFGDLVKKRLTNMQLSQQYLADTLNISKSAISHILNRDNISLDKMESIADALNCDLVIELKPRGEGNGK